MAFFNDRLVARIFLLFIIAYLAWSGYLASVEGAYVPINLSLLIMLLPVILFDGIKTAIESLYPRKHFVGAEDISKITVVIPTYNGAKVLEATINDLLKKFPGNAIVVASNGSTDDTCAIARRLGVRVLDFPQPIGKVEAINRAVKLINTPYTLILDDDTLIGDAVMPTSALDQGYQGVAFTVLPVKQGFWTQMQRHEYRKSMSVGKNYHNHTATVQNISGAIGLFQTKELQRQTEIHTGEFSGEDLQRTLLIHLSSQKGGVIMSDSIVETLAPNSFAELYKQRVFGWYPGFLANYDKYLKLVFRRKIPKRLRYEAFFNAVVLAALDPLRLLSLPVLLFNPVYIVFFYVVYVCLEMVPYFSMGAKEPFWVVFAYPIYGMFNFLTRVLAMAVFFYRRLTAWIGRAKKFDDYKFMRMYARMVGVALSTSIAVSILLWYSAIVDKINIMEESLLASLNEPAKISVFEPNITVFAAEENRNSGFRYVAKPGDNEWIVAAKAVDEYVMASGKTDINKNLLTYWVVTLNNSSIVAGQVATIPYSVFEEALKKI